MQNLRLHRGLPILEQRRAVADARDRHQLDAVCLAGDYDAELVSELNEVIAARVDSSAPKHLDVKVEAAALDRIARGLIGFHNVHVPTP